MLFIALKYSKINGDKKESLEKKEENLKKLNSFMILNKNIEAELVQSLIDSFKQVNIKFKLKKKQYVYINILLGRRFYQICTSSRASCFNN